MHRARPMDKHPGRRVKGRAAMLGRVRENGCARGPRPVAASACASARAVAARPRAAQPHASGPARRRPRPQPPTAAPHRAPRLTQPSPSSRTTTRAPSADARAAARAALHRYLGAVVPHVPQHAQLRLPRPGAARVRVALRLALARHGARRERRPRHEARRARPADALRGRPGHREARARVARLAHGDRARGRCSTTPSSRATRGDAGGEAAAALLRGHQASAAGKPDEAIAAYRAALAAAPPGWPRRPQAVDALVTRLADDKQLAACVTVGGGRGARSCPRAPRWPTCCAPR